MSNGMAQALCGMKAQ